MALLTVHNSKIKPSSKLTDQPATSAFVRARSRSWTSVCDLASRSNRGAPVTSFGLFNKSIWAQMVVQDKVRHSIASRNVDNLTKWRKQRKRNNEHDVCNLSHSIC